jgi:hypothetical protein
MKATSINRKHFQIFENGQQLGELVYEDLLYQKASIALTSNEQYKLAPAGFFDSKIIVTKNDTEIASLEMNWNGKIAITFTDGRKYLFKLDSFFDDKYSLQNDQEETLIQVDAKFDWRKFRYNYDLSYDITNNAQNSYLLPLLAVYAANYFISAMSGASAGAI